jgi:hypothetical protein
VRTSPCRGAQHATEGGDGPGPLQLTCSPDLGPQITSNSVRLVSLGLAGCPFSGPSMRRCTHATSASTGCARAAVHRPRKTPGVPAPPPEFRARADWGVRVRAKRASNSLWHGVQTCGAAPAEAAAPPLADAIVCDELLWRLGREAPSAAAARRANHRARAAAQDPACRQEAPIAR